MNQDEQQRDTVLKIMLNTNPKPLKDKSDDKKD